MKKNCKSTKEAPFVMESDKLVHFKTDSKDFEGRFIPDQSFKMIVHGRSYAVLWLPSKPVGILGNGLFMAYTEIRMNEWCK